MRAELYWIREDLGATGWLAIAPRPRAGDWLSDEVGDWFRAGVAHVVSLLTSTEEVELGLEGEAAEVRAAGLGFTSLPIEDRSVPASRVDFMRTARMVLDLLMQGKSVLIHCRQGIGRSSLLAAAVLTLSGSNQNDAFEKIAHWRRRGVPDTREQRAWFNERAA